MRTAAIRMILATSAAMWMSASYGWPVEGLQEEAQFANWLEGLRTEAINAGISEATVEAALTGITPLERVVELDRNQPEFRLDFWTYLDRVASEERIERGRRLLESHRELLSRIGSCSPVSPHAMAYRVPCSSPPGASKATLAPPMVASRSFESWQLSPTTIAAPPCSGAN